eukprot:m.9080 g.9080  ORF g.9080 m.9080 type:complete len:736 (-) comp2593_c0_seq1:38-2245(-)
MARQTDTTAVEGSASHAPVAVASDDSGESIWADVEAVCWPAPHERASVLSIWLNQGIEFSPEPGLHSYIVQHENGPCGLIAPIQALVIQQLLHTPPSPPIDPSTANVDERDDAFAAAVAQALLRAGNFTKAVLALPVNNEGARPGHLPPLDFLELETSDLDIVKEAVVQNLEHFYSKSGVVLLLYSLVLSRGTGVIQGEPTGGPLVGADGCCDHALVNLVLTGKASNLVDSDAWPDLICPVGFLTSEAHYSLAPCFASPAYPVWVVHGGGHYSVLFSQDEAVLEVGGPIPLSLSEFDQLPSLVAVAEHERAKQSAGEGDGPDTGAAAASSLSELPESEDAQLARALAMSMDDTPGGGGSTAMEWETSGSCISAPAPDSSPKDQRSAESTADTSSLDARPLIVPSPAAPMSPPDESVATTPMDDSASQAAKRMRNASPVQSPAQSLAHQDPNTYINALANADGGGEDEELARALALSMAEARGVPLQREHDAVAALTQLRDSSAGGGGGGAAGTAVESLEDEQLSKALALSMETATQDAQTRSRQATFVHYNGLAPHYIKEERRKAGLPPSTIRVVEFVADLLGGAAAAPTQVSSPDHNINAARKIHMVLQHRPASVHGNKVDGPFEYLVVCQPDGSMEAGARPRGPGKWRCRDCHLKVPPEWSAYNDESSMSCRNCGQSIDVCGYCHWVTRDALPETVRRSFDDEHAPPIVTLLRRRWAKATVPLERSDLPKLFG